MAVPAATRSAHRAVPRRWQVLGLGCIAIDEALVLERFPGPDGKTAIVARGQRIGGTTAAALLAARQIVPRVAYAGMWGTGAGFELAGRCFDNAQIERSQTRFDPNSKPIACVTLTSRDPAERRDRRVLYDLGGATPLADDGPSEETIAATEVLLVDHFGMRGMIAACHLAKRHGVEIVADFESDERPEFAELLALPDHLILSWPFAARVAGANTPRAAAERLSLGGSRTVVITLGGEGCVAVEPGSTDSLAFSFGPAIDGDSTGCGDVFHGVYAARLALREPLLDRLRWASAAARAWIARPAFDALPPHGPAIDALLRGSRA